MDAVKAKEDLEKSIIPLREEVLSLTLIRNEQSEALEALKKQKHDADEEMRVMALSMSIRDQREASLSNSIVDSPLGLGQGLSGKVVGVNRLPYSTLTFNESKGIEEELAALRRNVEATRMEIDELSSSTR